MRVWRRAPRWVVSWVLALTGLLAATGCEKVESEATDTIEVAVFYGGYGDDFFKEAVAGYVEARGGEVQVDFWSDPRVDVKVRPRILQGDPPDVINPLPGTVPLWKLIPSGELYPFDEALDGPAWDDDSVTWRETFSPGAFDVFTNEGKVYGIPYVMTIWVIWYDRAMFREHGWEPPHTWDEFVSLCAEIKKTDIAPIAFHGLYPHFYGWPNIVATFQRIGGMEKYNAYQNIEPGVFVDPDFIRALELWQELSTTYFQQGCWGMGLDAQVQWAKGKAAMIPCGLWLRNELGENVGPGFEMDCFALPVVDGKEANAQYQPGGQGGQFFVFSRSDHPRESMDFVRFLTSRKMMRRSIEMLDGLNPIPSSYDEDVISPELAGAVEIVRRAKGVYDDRVWLFYVPWIMQTLPSPLTKMLQGEMTPEELARFLEETMDEQVRKNPDVYKPPPLTKAEH